MWKPASILGLILGPILGTALATCAERETVEPGASLMILAPRDGDVAFEDALAVLDETLAKMGHDAEVVRVTPGEAASLIAKKKPALVVALDAQRLDLDQSDFSDDYPPAHLPFDDRFAIDLAKDDRTTVVALSAKSGLGRFYAVYEFLRRLGARYFHPEDEWIPLVPEDQLAVRAATPTALGAGPTFTPDFGHRSFSFHGAHPLEHVEAFSDARHPIDEALHVNDWMIKNRGDLFRGPGRGVAPEAESAKRAQELEAFRVRRGLRRQAGITLHNQQQGATADLDPTSSEPVAQQIARIVQRNLEGAADAYGFGIHFGPTELTTTPDLETVEWIDLAGEAALALRPALQIEVNDHTTGSQPVEHYDDLGCPPGTNDRGVSDYYDLAFHTDERFAAKVHTVMFPPLEGPAGVYQQETFAHKLCLMQKASAAGRPLVYFPESAYWLSWDNAVPVYLPLYIATRHRDVELLRPLLVKNGGTLRDHRLFDSGQEWGYWQADYAVGLLHWNAEIPLDEILGEMADPLCAADAFRSCPARTTYVEVLTEVMAEQWAAFLTTPDYRGRPGGLYTYFAGEDPADELGARSGLEFRPVRLAFRDVAGLDDVELAAFEAIDLAELRRLGSVFAAAAARLSATDVSADGQRWLDEVLDGLMIDSLRARHTAALYEVVVLLRDAAPEDAVVIARRDAARSLLEEARIVIERREAGYRYPLPQMIGGGVTPDTAVPNGTTYPYRVHTKTHLLSYWENRQQQVEDTLAGRAAAADAVALTPVFAAPDVPVAIAWPAIDGLTGNLDMGDGSAIAVATTAHDYETPGIYRVEGLLDTAGAPLPVAGYVARTALRATMASGDFELLIPDSSLARTVLASLVPTLRFALALEPGQFGQALALLAEPGGPESGPFDAVVRAPVTLGAAAGFTAGLFDWALPFPDPSTGEVAATVGLSGATITAPSADLLGPLTLSGSLSVADLVDALVALAGFERNGATETLAGVLGFDPAAPPETVPFSAELTLTPDL